MKVSECHDYNTRSILYNFKVPKANTVIQKTFYWNAISQWNQLPDHLKSLQVKDTFKAALKKHLRSVAVMRESY